VIYTMWILSIQGEISGRVEVMKIRQKSPLKINFPQSEESGLRLCEGGFSIAPPTKQYTFDFEKAVCARFSRWSNRLRIKDN